jgi:hypothetical protein
MHNITLISTNHTESGKCNADELYKIIESIKPEIIFEELPSKSFNDYYNGKPSSVTLEVKCIKNYLQNHNIEHIPVDDIADPNRHPLERLMFKKFERDTEYKKLKYEHNLLKKQKGFDYLNSHKCIDIVEKWILEEKRILGFFDAHNNTFLDTYKLFYEDVNNRENSMLQNIYNYSRENQYNQAVFLLGAGHRKSIMQKIAGYEKMTEIKLNWKIYSNK